MARDKARHAAAQQRYRQRHRERISQQNQSYYQQHREEILARGKKNRRASAVKGQGALLRQHRQSLGLSQQQYAAALEVPQSSVSLWENEKAPINPEKIMAVYPELGQQLKNLERRETNDI